MTRDFNRHGVHARAARRRAAALARLGPGPFTASTALRHGLTRDDLRSRDIRNLGRGVFTPATTPSSLLLHAAGVLLVAPPEARLAAFSAAALQGYPVPHSDRLWVSVPRGTRWQREGVGILRHEDPALQHEKILETRYGPLCVTHPVTLPTELVTRLPFVELVVLADAVLRREGDLAPQALAEWAAQRHLAQMADLACGGAESAMESRTRLLLHFAGLPPPVLQHVVRIDGRRRRFDLAYPEAKVAVEYDGDHHFASERARHEDALRREAVARAGWVSVSVVAHGIYRDPGGTVERVVRQLTARGMRVHVRDDWKRYFPQRS